LPSFFYFVRKNKQIAEKTEKVDFNVDIVCFL